MPEAQGVPVPGSLDGERPLMASTAEKSTVTQNRPRVNVCSVCVSPLSANPNSTSTITARGDLSDADT
jgi:hypothetical protein